jgi:uncharacterized protein with HEPN domain
MPLDRDQVRLRHMLDFSREAVAMLRGQAESHLASDRMLELALVRLVEIIGEAAARVSSKARARHPQIPWAVIVGMRNRLVHGYDRVDLAVLWETVTHDLPALIRELESVLPLDQE